MRILLVREKVSSNLLPEEAWTMLWITAMNWNWMDENYGCLKSANVVVDRDLVRDPVRALEAVPEAVDPDQEAVLDQDPVLVPALSPDPSRDPNLDPNPVTQDLDLVHDPNQQIAMETLRRTEIATNPSHDPDPGLVRNPDLDPSLQMRINNSKQQQTALFIYLLSSLLNTTVTCIKMCHNKKFAI